MNNTSKESLFIIDDSPIASSSPKKSDDEDENLLVITPPEYCATLVSENSKKSLPPLPPRSNSPIKKKNNSKNLTQNKSNIEKNNSEISPRILTNFEDLKIKSTNTTTSSKSTDNDESLTNSTFLNDSLDQIELSRREIDLVADELTSTTSSSISYINSIKKILVIPCLNHKLPFTLRGGAEKALLICIDSILHPDILDKLHPGDILLNIQKNNVPGMILRDANNLFQSIVNNAEEFEIQYILEGKIPNDLRTILSDKTYSDLQQIIRDNVYAKVVPYTTRPPKEGEIDNEHYNFVSVETFVELQRNEMLLEQGCFQGHFYGTPRPDDIDDNSTALYSEDLKSTDIIKKNITNNMVNDMTLLPTIDDNLGALPPNWEVAYSEAGEKYFIDHNNGTTQWEDPRDILPEGWERVDDEMHGTFYVDHINKRTQYERPTFSNVLQTTTTLKKNGFHDSENNNNTNNNNGYHFQGAASSSQFNTNGWSHMNSNQQYVQKHSQNGQSGQIQNYYQQFPIKQKNSPKNNMYSFTRDPNKLHGELITTRIQKGPYGLGFTLIGNDGTNSEPEFIQIKKIIPGEPAALDNVLHQGDVLVRVNDVMMLGATQDDVCRVFRSIPDNDFVTLQVCRGYPLILDPTNKIITENAYKRTLNHGGREVINVEIQKGEKGYGFTIIETPQGQRVKSIHFPDQCPNLVEGDIIYEVDGQNVRMSPHDYVLQLLKGHPKGYKTNMLVSRLTSRHRSRTPTAAFRYGEHRTTPVPIIQPRSKTPAPAPLRPTKSPVVRQYQAVNLRTRTNGVASSADIYENMKPSSTTLGFASTPNYVPITAFNHEKNQRYHLVTVNLIRKSDGFGFRLMGGQGTKLPLIVGEIIPGGAADLDGRLKVNDEIVEIDGYNVESYTHKEGVERIVKSGHVGHVKLVVRRHITELPRSTSLPFSNNYMQCDTDNHYQLSDINSPYTVDLAKLDHEEFGCTIISINQFYINNIIPNSPAARCGKLHEGDCVIAINNIPTYNMDHKDVINYIRSSGNTISFTIDPTKRLKDIHFRSKTLRNRDSTTSQIYAQMPHKRYSSMFTDNGNYEMDKSLIHVEIHRGIKGFGFSIRGGWEFNQMPLRILKIADDGPAAADGRLIVGDLIIEINGESTIKMRHEQAIRLITEHNVVRLIVQRPIFQNNDI